MYKSELIVEKEPKGCYFKAEDGISSFRVVQYILYIYILYVGFSL